MNYIGKFISNFKDFYNEINSATLTGAIDVIVIQQPDGTYLCSPFHVRFGKIGVLRSREKVVDIEVNGKPVDIHMKLGESGEAFFVEEVEDENEIPQLWATSPLPPVPDIGEELRKLKIANDINDDSAVDGNKSVSTEKTDFALTATSHEPVISESTPAVEQENRSTKNLDPNQNFVPDCDSYDISENQCFEVDSCALLDENVTVGEQAMVSGNTDDAQDISKNKRRKRKRTVGKKRAKSREICVPSSLCASDIRERTVDEPDSCVTAKDHFDEESLGKHEDIFQMDDDYGESEDDEGYPCASHGLSRSVSLPLNSNKAVCLEWPSRKLSSTFTGEFHPFSDGDVTPPSSPTESRPASPKSDTEYENQKQDTLIPDGTEPSWGWGQLPNVPKNSQLSTQDQGGTFSNVDDGNKVSNSDGAEKRSMLGGMLNFMRSTKKIRHQPESEGILLQSVESTAIDPEIASLYFPRYRSAGLGLSQNSEVPPSVKDEDTESGKGPSLPQSPHSVEGAIGGPCCSIDSDCEDRQYLYGFYTDVEMSLCGGLLDAEAELSEERFKNFLVTYDQFTENPSVLFNPNLVIKLGSKYYNWQAAAPMLTSMIMFQRALPEKTVNQLVSEYMPKKKKSKSYSSWWSWRRYEGGSKTETPTEPAETPTSETSEFSKTEDTSLHKVICDKGSSSLKPESKERTKTGNGSLPRVDSEVLVPEDKFPQKEQTAQKVDKAHQAADSLTEIVFTLPSRSNSSASTSPVNMDPNALQAKDELSVPVSSDVEGQNVNCAKELEDTQPKKEKYKKSLRLTSEQIASLNLKRGPNEVVFSVTTAYQGTTRCKCDIYLWNYDDKIVISDIDGTITKSDVLGHILPMVGKDWAQFGVAGLFTKIYGNGYQFLYLSARAIGQARITRDYLRSVRQGEVCLPDGPLLLSPTSLISALHREVIEKKPEEFKISCLKDIQTLYPQYMGNPFYAGFGNKINDTWAYRAVGIPITRVFTINHRGELKLELIQTFQSSYTRLSDQVDHIFPPQNCSRKINGFPAPTFTASEEFSYFTYWRQPISPLSDSDELLD